MEESKELVIKSATQVEQSAASVGITNKQQLEIIKDSYCKGYTDSEMIFFFEYCRAFNLIPGKHVITFKGKSQDDGSCSDSGKINFHLTIDAFRVLAERTGQYDGTSETLWFDKNNKWLDVWLSDQPPLAAKVIVYRKDKKYPFIGIALWKEYGSNKKIWAKMPSHMLAKCAESLALRKAFPLELGGVYTKEEIDTIEKKENEVISAPINQTLVNYIDPNLLQDERKKLLGEIAKEVNRTGTTKDAIEKYCKAQNIPNSSMLCSVENLKMILSHIKSQPAAAAKQEQAQYVETLVDTTAAYETGSANAKK